MIKKVKLGDLVEFQRGYDLPKSSAKGGIYPVVTSNGIMTYHNEYKSGKSVVVGRSGTIGNPQLIEKDFWPHNTTLYVKDFKDNNIEYIYYLLLNMNIGKMKSGSNIPTLNRNHLHPLETLAETDIEKQKKLAGVLKSIDNKIESNNKINKELESMAKTIYDYWFLQFEFPNEEGKPYKSSGGEMVWNEELKKEIPVGWEVKRVDSILEKIPKTKKYLTSEYENVGKYPIIDQSKKYIAGFTNDKDDVLNYESAIVFGDHTKEIKYINFPFARGADGTQILISKHNALSNYLLYLQLQQIDLQNQGYSRYFKFLKEKNIVIPSKIVNDNFNRLIASFCVKMKSNLFENIELGLLRDYLLPMLMNGQIKFAK